MWPLILYLHGLDKANSSVKLLKNDPPLISLENQDYFPFIVVAPKASGEYEIWATDEMIDSVSTLLDEIQDVLSVDTNRFYLTGVSAGGNGAWEIGLHYPDRFAALAPFMGYYGWPFSVPENICDFADVPVRAFHGEKDETTPLEAEQNITVLHYNFMQLGACFAVQWDNVTEMRCPRLAMRKEQHFNGFGAFATHRHPTTLKASL